MPILISLVAVAVLTASIFGMGWVGFQMHAYFSPKYAEVDRQVFEQSQSYNEGMIRDLENLKIQYQSLPKGDGRDALKQVIRHRFEVYQNVLPPHLAAFFNEIESGNTQ